jgi:AcrR family transcriptional regulator
LILDQALALVDERGLAAMSMRAVAERVGLTSMALYPYVGGKDALLDGLVDLLHAELGGVELGGVELGGVELGGVEPGGVEPGGGGIGWRHRLHALGRAVRALAYAHPGAFPLLLNRSAAGASASWMTAALRGILHDAGVPGERVPRLARMICAFLLGYTTGEVTGGLPAPETPEPPGTQSPGTQSPGTQSPGTQPGDAEFEADLADLVRLVEVAVRVG